MTGGGFDSSRIRSQSPSLAAFDPTGLAKGGEGKGSTGSLEIDRVGTMVDEIINRNKSEVIFEAEIRLETEGNENLGKNEVLDLGDRKNNIFLRWKYIFRRRN